MPDMEFTERLGREADADVVARVNAQARMGILFLRKKDTDQTFGWTPVLALRDDMLPCSKDMAKKLRAKLAHEGAMRSKNLNSIRITAERKAEAEANLLEEQGKVQAELLANEDTIMEREAAEAEAREKAEAEAAAEVAKAKSEVEAAEAEAEAAEAEAAEADKPSEDGAELDVTSPPPPVEVPLAEQSKADLVVMAGKMGLPVTGNKGELIARIESQQTS